MLRHMRAVIAAAALAGVMLNSVTSAADTYGRTVGGGGGGGGGGVGIAAAHAVATSNISLSGTQTIDGVAVIAGDRVLVTGETAAATNGIYVAASGAWARSSDFATSGQMLTGTLVPVYAGTIFGGSFWQFTTTGTITVGSTSLTFLGPQSSANVNITGGIVTGTNAATRTVSGIESAADKAFLTDLYGWQQTQYNTMIAADPALTGFWWVKPGEGGRSEAESTTPTSEALAEGGGISSTSVLTTGVSIFQNTPGGHWAYCYRVRITANGVGNTVQLGIGSNAGPSTNYVYVGSRNATDTTHYVWEIAASGVKTTRTTTTLVDTTNYHDHCLVDDGTTLHYMYDGAQIDSTTTRTNLVATAMHSSTFTDTATNFKNVQFMVGYVKP